VALGAHEQDPARGPGADEGVGDVKARQETGALHPEVDRVRARDAERVREQAAVSGKVVIRGHGREHEEVEVPGLEARVRERAPGGLGAEHRGGLPAPRESPLGDAGALADPLVGGVHQEREALVRHPTLRHEHAGAPNHRPDGRHAPILTEGRATGSR
jgi:hypothetical protein